MQNTDPFANTSRASDFHSIAEPGRPVVVHVHFRHALSETEYAALCLHAAPAIAGVDGLVWKLFVVEGSNEAGGVYLFRDRSAAEAYLAGPIIEGLRSHPAVRGIAVRIYDLLEDATAVTAGHVPVACLSGE